MRFALVMVLLFAVAGFGWPEDVPRGGRIPWERDVERGLRESAAQERPAMLYFTADW